MRTLTTGMLLAGVVLAGTWGLGGIGRVGAQEEVKAGKTSRGSLLAKAQNHQFEVFFYPTGLRVFPQTAAGQTVDISRASGSATFYHPNSSSPWFSRPLRATPGRANSLDLTIGLGNAPTTGAKVTIEVSGLTDVSESQAIFTVPLEFVPQPTSRPTAPQGGVAAVPRYTYGPGFYGYGYYPFNSPTATSPPASAYHAYSSPSRHFGGDGDSVGPGHRDWSTGRDIPLAKPWMKPMD
jgi:hypothetical protein